MDAAIDTRPAGWPLPYEQPAGSPAVAKARRWPPAEWPTQAQLGYTKELITVVLLVLALPWLVHKLLTHPGAVLAGLGQRAAGRAGSG